MNHSDPMSTIDHDSLDDVTGACAPACKPGACASACTPAAKPATPATLPAQTGRHGWPFAFQQQQQQQQQQQGMPPQFDFRGWMSNFMRRFGY